MCGPLVLAFPGRSGRLSAHLAYHLGRLSTYGAVGVFMGAAGSGLSQLAVAAGGDPLAWTARVQVLLSLLAAALLASLGLARVGLIPEPAWLSLASPPTGAWFGSLRRGGAAGSPVALAGLGLLMGLLPCGLSFAAFASAMASGDLRTGGAIGLAFGLGTLPGLLTLGLGVGRLARRFRRQSDLLSGVLMLLMALQLAAEALPLVMG